LIETWMARSELLFIGHVYESELSLEGYALVASYARV